MIGADAEKGPPEGTEPCRDLISVCSDALSIPVGHPIATQVSRVLADIVDRRPSLNVDSWSQASITKAFHTYGLIPETLRFSENAKQRNEEITEAFNELSRHLPCDNGLCARICFAAAAYPQRMWQFPGRFSELILRINAFREFTEFYAANQPIADSLARAVRYALSEEIATVTDVQTLVSDIAGGRDVAAVPDDPVVSGAALYLATCHRSLLKRILSFWRDDANSLRAMRSYFGSPPSCLGSDQNDLEKNRRNRSDIPEIVRSDVGIDTWKKINAIERASWGAAKKWPQVFRQRESVQEVWESLWDNKLQSEFPYYSFRSHFRTWWLQEFSNYRFGAIDVDITEIDYQLSVGHPLPNGEDSSLPSIDDLRIYREGYRMVRTSFFSRDNSGLVQLRQAIDALWYFHLERKLGEEDVKWGDLKKLIEHLSTIYGDQSGKLLPAYNKLRLRMWAYVLGRTTRRSNAQILRTERPIGYKEGGKPYPLKDAKGLGVEMISTLARVAHRDHSLLWIFTANVFLRHQLLLNPTYKVDRWGLEDYLQELWHWVSDPFFMRTVEYGQTPPDEYEQEEAERRGDYGRKAGRADRLAWIAMQQEPLKAALASMAELDTEEDVQEFLARQSLDSVKKELCGVLTRELGSIVFGIEELKGDWRRTIGWPKNVATHWVVPVWFLVKVEKLTPAQVIAELNVEESEQAGVRVLAEQWNSLWKDIVK